MRADLNNRRKQILDVLVHNPVVRVSELLAMFDVSDETLRKDLIAMERQRVLIRRHGCVELISRSSEEALDVRAASHLQAKERIAIAALDYIPNKDGDVIGLDSGSTTWHLAQLLAKRKSQTIVTNSLKIADVFSASDLSNNVYCAGGILRNVDKSFYGPWTMRNLGAIRMTVSVLASNGVRNWDGLGSVSYDDADVKRAYVTNSEQAIAIFDSSKFRMSTLIEAVRWEELDVVITDDGIGDKDRERIEGKTKLVIV